MDLDADYAATLVAAVLLGTGFVLQQYSAGQEPESRFLSLRILTDLLGKPRWLAGIGCMVAGYLLAAWSIGQLELTLVEPLHAIPDRLRSSTPWNRSSRRPDVTARPRAVQRAQRRHP